MIQFDDHIFQMGWFNHQLDFFSKPTLTNLGKLHSGKLTWLAGKWLRIGDVSPIQNGDVPLPCQYPPQNALISQV